MHEVCLTRKTNIRFFTSQRSILCICYCFFLFFFCSIFLNLSTLFFLSFCLCSLSSLSCVQSKMCVCSAHHWLLCINKLNSIYLYIEFVTINLFSFCLLFFLLLYFGLFVNIPYSQFHFFR